MIGAILGDMVGSPYEFDRGRKIKDFGPLFIEASEYTDDSVMTVPEAITAFLEGTDFEDVVRCAVSLGGDCDTLTCIASGIAEAFYGVPEELRLETLSRLEADMRDVLLKAESIKADTRPSTNTTTTK